MAVRALHVTNGDAVAPAVAETAGVALPEVVVWRDVLHEGPVPAGMGPAGLATVRARHLGALGWADEAQALADMRSRDVRLEVHPAEAEVVLWFEDDLFDDLQRFQVEDRLAGRPGPVSRVRLPHAPHGDLRAAFAARTPVTPDPAPFAALRSDDPHAWLAVPELQRLLEELPDPVSGLGRLEREILEALADGPLEPPELFEAVAAREAPPWLGDLALWHVADELQPLVENGYALAAQGRRVLAGAARRSPPIGRCLGGVLVARFSFEPSSRIIARCP